MMLPGLLVYEYLSYIIAVFQEKNSYKLINQYMNLFRNVNPLAV